MSIVARFVLLLGVIAVITLGFVRISLPAIYADDDNIWLYSVAGALTTRANENGDPEKELNDRVRAAGTEEASTRRFDMRLAYRTNYLLPMLVWGVARNEIDPGSAPTPESYGQKVVATIIAGATASHALAALILALGLLATGRFDLIGATFGGLTLLLLLAFIFPPHIMFLFWELHGLEALTNALWFAVNPGAQFSVFGFTPRSQLALLVLLAFVLRWRGWIGPGYAVLALAGLVHQSQTTLFFPIVMCIDLALRPASLRPLSVWPFVLLGISLIATRETLWSYVAAPDALLRVILVLAAGAIFMFAMRGAMRAGYLAWLSSIRGRINTLPLYATDGLVLGCGWLASLPLGYILAQYASAAQRLYFWDQVHSRTWLLIAPVIATAIALAVWNKLANTGFAKRLAANPLPVALAGTLLVVLPFAVLTRPGHVVKKETSRLRSEMQAVTRQLDVPIDHAPGMAEEPVLYLAAARQRDTGELLVRKLLPQSVPPPRRSVQ